MSNKLIITKINVKSGEKIFCGIKNDKRFYKIDLLEASNDGIKMGDIVIGRVKDIVKNIEAAFIEYGKGLTGYFSLKDNKNIIYLNNKNTDKLCQGDLIIVQMSKAAVKTKFPVLSSNISLTGKNVVLNISKAGIGYSNKIEDRIYREKIASKIKEEIPADVRKQYGVVIRTNAYEAEDDVVVAEIKSLWTEWEEIVNAAKSRVAFSVLRHCENTFSKYFAGVYENEIKEVVTDDEEIFEIIKEYIPREAKLVLYKDELLELKKLYSIESALAEIKAKKVWLKSGAYLVMEPTEAMYVIDVNTGKCIKGKKTEETVFNVNMEAAEEIAYQLQFRNISGMILVDFINMENENNQEKLVEFLKKCVNEDKIRTNVIDITKLNLVEMTRKKVEAPLYELI